MCLLKITRWCEIAWDSFILSARLRSCQRSREISMLYPDNNPSLYTFHNNSIWKAVTAVTAFISPPVVELPPLHLQETAGQGVVADQVKFTADYRRLAQNSKQNLVFSGLRRRPVNRKICPFRMTFRLQEIRQV